jgi:hypothetical protein
MLECLSHDHSSASSISSYTTITPAPLVSSFSCAQVKSYIFQETFPDQAAYPSQLIAKIV